MKHNASICITLELDVDVILDTEREDDDDGCGSPSASGNSMTGSRGSSLTCESVSLDMTDIQLAHMVRRAFDKQIGTDDPAIDSAMEDISSDGDDSDDEE